MKKKAAEFLINVESLYLSMACVFFCMAIFRILTVGASPHEYTHLIISSAYLILGIILFIIKK